MEILKISHIRLSMILLCIVLVVVMGNSPLEARPSVGLDLEKDPDANDAILARITLLADPGEKIQAAGLTLVYPADRVTFTGKDSIDGVVIKTGLSKGKNVLTIGIVDVGGHERLDLTLHFSLLGSGLSACVPMAIVPDRLQSDIAGASVSPVRAYCPKVPGGLESWSNRDVAANLFLIVPNLRGLKAASIFYGNIDVTAAMGIVGSYFYDPIKDVLYYILPGISLPQGQYPLTINWDYGQGPQTTTVTIGVMDSD